jgi:2-oxoglutarate dehydrogenase E2 component (dihydrolipoamide succinyltransferase)
MPISITAPQMGESVPEGTIGKWHKKVGDKVQRDDVLVEIQTDKVTVEVPSAFSGTLVKITVAEGQIVKVGQEMAVLLKEGESMTDLAPAVEAAKPAPMHRAAESKAESDAGDGRVRTSPAIRRLAREQGIDLNLVKPTGPQGRIRKEDLEVFMQKVPPASVRVAQPAASGPSLTQPTRPIPVATFSRDEKVERRPIEGVRKIIAEHMVRSKHISPHVMTLDEVDMTELVKFRNKHEDAIMQRYGVKLTYMAFFIKAATSALKHYPTVNASMTDQEIIIKKFYHIGVAVAREEGLIVPVIKHADSKPIIQLAAEIADLAERARTEKLNPDDIQGGTFTLTNAGMFGALASTPVINQPQVAILGIHAIQKRAVVRDDQIVARDMMYLALSFDHRLIDGHTAVQFLREVCENIEQPANMLLT